MKKFIHNIWTGFTIGFGVGGMLHILFWLPGNQLTITIGPVP